MRDRVPAHRDEFGFWTPDRTWMAFKKRMRCGSWACGVTARTSAGTRPADAMRAVAMARPPDVTTAHVP